MKCGFLTKLIKTLGWSTPPARIPASIPAPGRTPIAKAKAPVTEPVSDIALERLRVLRNGWEAEGALIELGAFMKSCQTTLEGMPITDKKEKNPFLAPTVQYFMLLSGLLFEMVEGGLPFFYPKQGLYNYPERDMFFGEHCYVAVADLVKRAYALEEDGARFKAEMVAESLLKAMEKTAPQNRENLCAKGYLYESGATAKKQFFLSAHEYGISFSLILRLRPQNQKRLDVREP